MEIEIRSKYFGDTKVIGDISLSVDTGETIALTGPSGIGKTTLVRIIAGLERAYNGRIGHIGRVGFVFQEPMLLPWRSLLDNIIVATGCDKKTALQTLEQVELAQRADVFPNQLSLGQQRRVALARALAIKPKVLILDEAFASLDEGTSIRMREVVQRVLGDGNLRTILVTHSLHEAASIADRVVVLSGPPAKIALDHSMPVMAQRDLSKEIDYIRKSLTDYGLS